ncbi:MAG: four helix bundle protein [Candidatus Sungbacteria bacterium]|uniref:Four helix bundle protein n=1 Tax=Candidatus Sungiibacteriota bacterium TaxID=2750080 RepID=A0A9D6QRR6_9BACT|nr:four helix bundle protein [Candidatus Sungbacteria bacterium]
MQSTKSEARNTKQSEKNNIRNPKQYDLEERTLNFAKRVRNFVKKLPRNISNIEDSKQIIRSSGSIGANYIEANEALSKKDFVIRIKISGKESKETRYWLRLLDNGNNLDLENESDQLIQEATELMMILSSIMRNSL